MDLHKPQALMQRALLRLPTLIVECSWFASIDEAITG
jgi:hypothetical protein